MKRAIIAAIALLAAGPAHAGVTCSLPFNLQNGTTADASQVMANYNALVTCLANAAAAGANNDITSLSALSTPITPTQGGTPVYVGGTSTGSANAQAVASVTPSSFSLTAGRQVTFIAGFSNTGATTLNVALSGATNVYRRTQLGVSALVGGEIVAGQVVTVIYDGTQFQLLGPTYTVGEGKDWFATSAPAGYLLRDGTSYLRADYPDLFAVIGTTYGAADGAHFNVPDDRGRISMMRDTAGRLSSSACSAANVLGTICGQSNGLSTVQQSNLPNVDFTVSGISASGTFSPTWQGFTGAFVTGSGAPALVNSNANVNSSTVFASSTSVSVSIDSQGTAASGGSGTGLPIVSNTLIVNKIIKY